MSNIRVPVMPAPVGFTDKSWLARNGGGQFSRRSFPGMQLPIHTAEQLAARDAQWLEMVGPVVDRLLAASNYIDTLGGNSKTYRAALSAITKD